MMLVTKAFLKTCINGLKLAFDNTVKGINDKLSELLQKAVNADLSVNDRSHPAYVKNRTHWETEEVLASCVITVSSPSDYGFGKIPSTAGKLSLGDPCTVYVNGVPYETKVKRVYYGGSYFSYLVAMMGQTSEELPVSIYGISDMTSVQVHNSVNFPAEIKITKKVVAPLDQKFLPSGFAKIPIFTTEGTGEAYTATVEGMTRYENGQLAIMIPHTGSAVKSPTLKINDLDALNIKRFQSAFFYRTVNGYAANWLFKGCPILLQYSTHANVWIALNFNQALASDIAGTVVPANGGTGSSYLTRGSYLVGNGSSAVTLRTPAEVLNDIGAMPSEIASSTEGSTKKFKIEVDDSGTLTATEVTETTE